MFGYVYKTTNTINGKFYIGKSSGEFKPEYYGSGLILKHAIQKYGKDAFTVEILKECNSLSELDDSEIKFISELCPEYNIARGGTGGDTLAYADPIRKKAASENRSIGLKKNWKNQTEEQLRQRAANISLAKKGKSNGRLGFKHSEETKLKIRATNKAQIKSDTWKENNRLLGLRQRGRPAPNRKQIEHEGIIYVSVKEACIQLGISSYILRKWIKDGKAKTV